MCYYNQYDCYAMRTSVLVQVILSNPDMLHASMLPNHATLRRFFSKLAIIAIDEIHA